MIVSEGAASYEISIGSFKNNFTGHYACVIIVNALNENIPCFFVVIHPTCNIFNANFVC